MPSVLRMLLPPLRNREGVSGARIKSVVLLGVVNSGNESVDTPNWWLLRLGVANLLGDFDFPPLTGVSIPNCKLRRTRPTSLDSVNHVHNDRSITLSFNWFILPSFLDWLGADAATGGAFSLLFGNAICFLCCRILILGCLDSVRDLN